MMPSNNNNINSTNESFKLLEISDDLRSLSDLELPEIINQKKRKVRRKTRSRTPSSRAHSSQNTNEPNLPCHKNLGIWIAVFMLGGWLFLLSYMTTVIHTENNRLKLEVEKLYINNMESAGHVTVPLRGGGKKMRKRRELDALVAHSLAKRACNSGKRNIAGNGINSQDQLLSQSTDDQEDYTWPKVRNSSRCRTKRLSCLKTCGPFVLITCVFMSFGFMYWLYFDLRQQINEYRMRIEQVSASSQNIPEAFQNWHETSKKLEQNQTMLQNSITEIREVLKNFSLELNQLKDNINKETKTSKESQMIELQSEIAGFGATIKDFKSNFDTITNDKLPKLQNDIQLNKESFINLTQLITKQLNATNLTSITTTSDSTNLIEELKLSLLKQIASVNGTLIANITELYEYYNQISEKVTNQHTLLEKNIDDILNMSTEITSIQNDWTQHKPTILSFEQFTKNVTQDMQDLRTNANNLNAAINLVNKDCKSMNDNITSDIQAIKENLDRTRNANDKSAVVPPPPPTTSLVPNPNKNASSNVSSSSDVTEGKPISSVTPTATPTVPVPSKNDDSPDFMR